MIQAFSNFLCYSVFGLNPASKFGETVNYFIYDTVKIYLLIIAVIAVISFIRTFLPPHKIKETLSKQRFGIGNLSASILGAVTPFCSCSSIPIFIGFLKAEVPLGIAFSFIITSPLVNEVVFVLMGSTFGWTIALLYAIAGITLGVIAGLILGKMKLEKEIILKFDDNSGKKLDPEYLPKSFEGKIQYSLSESFSTLKKLWFVIALGVAIGAAIHGYVPADFFKEYLNINSLLAVPLATLAGIPIYAGCSALVPVVFSLTAQGIPLGTALAFMMAIAGLSLPEAIMLKKVMSIKLLAIFFGTVAVGIILIGYLFNFISA
ncbi:MAG: permease [Candidatus Peregrinibacteria bacterium]|nr:permease [Candidatus Peregrinibacteria bacterium]